MFNMLSTVPLHQLSIGAVELWKAFKTETWIARTGTALSCDTFCLALLVDLALSVNLVLLMNLVLVF